MIETELPIIVIAYNRPKSLKRLLESLVRAKYPNEKIPLIISIDKADDNQEVVEIARAFKWQHGIKTINEEKTNLGLRRHVLQCGDLSQTYGSAILLEDDLYVSPNFYTYTKAALDFSDDKEYIAGVSLYNHLLNVHSLDAFLPIEDGYDNWYFQFASSWGQAWTKKQWKGFRNWYTDGMVLKASNILPRNVTDWSNKSWLKYYISYLVSENKYFLFPKIGFSTNFSDLGTHVGHDSTAFQVPLDYSNKFHYNFSSLYESNSIYDAFFENIKLAKQLGFETNELCVDLYGLKKRESKKYWLTSRIENYKIIDSFGRSLKPIETNILENIAGKDIFLYDTSVEEKNSNTYDRYRKLIYNIRFISRQDSIRACFIIHKQRINAFLKELFKL